MKFSCDECGASYMISDDKVGSKGVKVRCKRCSNSIIVRPEDVAAGAGDDMSDLPPDLEPESLAADANTADDAQDAPAPPSLDALAADLDAPAGGESDIETRVGAAPEGLAFSREEEAASGDTFASSVDLKGGDASADDFEEPTRIGETFDPAKLDALAQERDAGAFGGVTADGLGDDGLGDDDVPAPPAAMAAATMEGGAFEGGLDDDSLPAPPADEVTAPPSSPVAPSTEVGGEAAAAPSDGDAGLAGNDDDKFDAGFDDSEFNDAGFDDPGLDAPGLDEGADVPAPPGMDDAAAAADDGDGSDMLDDQIAGAFGAMFADPTSLPEPEDESFAPPEAPAGFDAASAEGMPGFDDPGFGDDGAAFGSPGGDFGDGGLDSLRNDLDASLGSASGEGFSNDSYGDGEQETIGGLDMHAPIGGPAPSVGDDVGASDDDEDVEWFVAIDDEEVGPLTIDQVEEEVAKGRVKRDSLVWKTGMDDWEPADEVAEVSGFFDTVQPGKYSSMLDGAPVDDDAPPPPSLSAGDDPFSNVPDMPGEEDASWQPHGLTEVYQAANLAEATQGKAKMAPGLGGLSSGEGPSLPDAPAVSQEGDDGWRPGAASALSALVEGEMGRLDDGPALPSATLEPADGNLSLASDALDDLSGASASSSALGATLAELEASSATPAAPGPAAPATTSMSTMPAVPEVSMAAPAAPSLPPTYAAGGGGRSPAIWIAGGLGLVMLLGVFGLAAIWMLKDSGSSNNGGGGAVAVAPGPDAKAPTPPAQPTKVALAPPAEGTAPPAGAAGEAAPAKADAAAAKKAEAAAPPPVEAKAETPPPEPKKAEPKRRSKKQSKKTRKTTKKKEKKKVAVAKPPPKKKKKRPSSSDCDPVLDFDCEEKKSSGPKKKKSLSKADILAVAKKNFSKIKACGKKHGVSGAKIKVRWKISRSGKTRGVKVASAKYDGTAVGGCLVRSVKKWRFPAYSGKEMKAITFPFKL